jgi:hypothetical protein
MFDHVKELANQLLFNVMRMARISQTLSIVLLFRRIHHLNKPSHKKYLNLVKPVVYAMIFLNFLILTKN